MKHFFFACALALSTSLLAVDRFVDPTLGSGNGSTQFSTITSAIAASVDGDRILIVSGNYAEPTLVLNKSLTLLPQNTGGAINFNGNITVTGTPGMKLQILGFNLGVYSLTCNAITSGTIANRAKVSVIDCKATNFNSDQDFYEFNCIRSVASSQITFRYGSCILSKTAILYINDHTGSNNATDKIVINADTVTNFLLHRQDDYKSLIANNLLNNFFYTGWNSLTSVTNEIRNNDFSAGCIVGFPWAGNIPRYNIVFSSNQFLGTLNRVCGCACSGGQSPYWLGDNNQNCTSTTSNPWPGFGYSGSFEWTYNGIALAGAPTGSQPLVFTNIAGQAATANGGNPNHEYYDIFDLSINDRGRTGGPYSTLNYSPTTSATGKAYIFDLEIPADLFPGQAVDIKAKGYHKN
jgi:hypothetical protein